MSRLNKYKISGLGTALVTPFKEEANTYCPEVDFEAYERLLERQVENVDFLVALGTTAETPCLREAERLKILELTLEKAKGKAVVVGCGTNSLEGTLANIKLYEKYDIAAYLIVTPYYNKPGQEGLFQYFSHLAKSTSKDIILYNVPSRTGVNIQAETVLRLAKIPNIIGIKEASGNLEQIAEILKSAAEDFAVYSGNDDQCLEMQKMGAAGLISVVSNLYPASLRSLIHAVDQGDEVAEQIDKKLTNLYKYCFVEANPIPVKAGLAIMNLCSAAMRLPLTKATEKTFELMKKEIEEYGSFRKI